MIEVKYYFKFVFKRCDINFLKFILLVISDAFFSYSITFLFFLFLNFDRPRERNRIR